MPTLKKILPSAPKGFQKYIKMIVYIIVIAIIIIISLYIIRFALNKVIKTKIDSGYNPINTFKDIIAILKTKTES